jgi:CCR4-NOT transcription complex subunit 4
MDPAILAVGKGRMAGLSEPVLDQKHIPVSSYPSHFSASPTNSDPRIQLLMQQALSSSNQNPRMVQDHVRDPYHSLTEGLNGNYGASRFVAQNYAQVSPHQQQRSSHLTNGSQWDGWSDLRMGGNVGMNEILRNERIMLNSNNLYAGNEENSFHLPGSDLYNRTFGL